MRTIKKFTLQMIAGANIATVLVTLLIGYSDRLHPESHPTLAVLGLAFPFFLVMNLAFLLFWLIFKPKGALIPIVGLLVCFSPVRPYAPLNIPREAPEGALKVMSYNVWMYAMQDYPDSANPIIDYIARSGCDIVCLQEAAAGTTAEKMEADALDSVYTYRESCIKENGSDRLVVFSKYPIVKSEEIAFPSESNHSCAFYVKYKGDTLLVVNNHFESVGLSDEEKEGFKGIIKGEIKGHEAKKDSKLLIHKLRTASARRAPQADAVARYISAHSQYSAIVCGDFNDSPISYTHRTVASGLTDCYRESGFGPGISYHRRGFYVRIDNLLCSKDFTPYGCKVDNNIKASDHYPIYCWLKKQLND